MRFYKQDKHLTEWENEDLTLKELRLKLIAVEEGHEDKEFIKMMKTAIKKRELMDEMKKISAKIGMYELQRSAGQGPSITELDTLKRQFRALSANYKKRFYS